MSEPKTVRLQCNVDLSPMGTKGQIIEVPVSRTGILKVKYWRRRLADAKTDKCVGILKGGDIGTLAKAAKKAEIEAKKDKSKAAPGANEGVKSDGK